MPMYAVALSALMLFGFDRGSCGHGPEDETGDEGRTDGEISEPGDECPGVACTLYCEYGFQRGEDGCEICACNGEPSGRAECESDADCGEGMVCHFFSDDGGCYVDDEGNENCPGGGERPVEPCVCDDEGDCRCDGDDGEPDTDTPVPPGGVCVPAEDPGVPPGTDCGVECPEGTQCMEICGCSDDQESEQENCSCEVSCVPNDPPSADDECQTDADCEDGALCVPTYTCMALGCPPSRMVCVAPGE